MLALPDEPVSPELALVDPVLRERLLRESLQELVDDRTEARVPQRRETFDPPARTDAAPSAHSVPRPGRAGRLLHSVLVGAVVTLVLALPSLAFLPPRQEPHLGRETLPPRPETIAWQPDASADYYVFELSSGGRLVSHSIVRAPSVTLGAAIPPGHYTWRVFVGRGPMAAHNEQGPPAGGTVNLG